MSCLEIEKKTSKKWQLILMMCLLVLIGRQCHDVSLWGILCENLKKLLENSSVNWGLAQLVW